MTGKLLSYLCLSIGYFSVVGCSTVPDTSRVSAEPEPVEIVFDASLPVTMSEGFEKLGELSYIEGETIGETIERAGGAIRLVHRPDVVIVRPGRGDPLNVLCLADKELTRPGDVFRAVRIRDFKRTYGCTLPDDPSNVLMGWGVVHSGIFKFEEGLAISEMLARAGGLYKEGYLQDVVWVSSRGIQYPKATCLAAQRKLEPGDFIFGIRDDELGARLDCSNPDEERTVGVRFGFPVRGDFAYHDGMTILDLVNLVGGFDETELHNDRIGIGDAKGVTRMIVCITDETPIYPGEYINGVKRSSRLECLPREGS